MTTGRAEHAKPWMVALIVGAAVAAYLTSLPVPFIFWDDPLYVTGNLRVQAPGLAGLAALWDSGPAWRGEMVEYFPLRDSLYWLTWQLAGALPLAYHLLSLLAHLGVSLSVLPLARRLGFSAATGWWGALLFAVHPAHVEAVTWVSGLKDPVCTLLVIGAVLSYFRFRERGGRGWYAAVLALSLAALLTKSLGLVTPVLLLAVERLYFTSTWRQVAARLALPVLLSGVFLVQFVLIGRANGVINPPHGGSWAQHGFLMAWALVRYVQQAFLPVTFRIHYCFPPLSSALDPRLLGIAAGLTAIALAVRFGRREHRAAALLAWFFACLAPVANVIPFPSMMADRYLYASSLAACLAVPWAAEQLRERVRWLLLVGLAAVFALVTAARGVFWQHEPNLWAEVVEDGACRDDRLVQAAVMYLKHGENLEDPVAALEAYEVGLSHRAFPELAPTARANFLAGGAAIARRAGQPQLAERWFAQAAAQRPDAELLFGMGLLGLERRPAQSREVVALAVSLDPARWCPKLAEVLARRPALSEGRLGEVLASCPRP